jgi:hypothetical protein
MTLLVTLTFDGVLELAGVVSPDGGFCHLRDEHHGERQ